MDYKKEFINNLKKYRKENNLTQDDLAEKLNYSQKNIAKWEQGLSIPSIDILIKLSKLMNMSLDELLGVNTKSIFDQCVDYILEMENLNPTSRLLDKENMKITTTQELIENNISNIFSIILESIIDQQSLKININQLSKHKTTRDENILNFLKENALITEHGDYFLISKDFTLELISTEEKELLSNLDRGKDVLKNAENLELSTLSSEEIEVENMLLQYYKSQECELETLEQLKKTLFKD